MAVVANHRPSKAIISRSAIRHNIENEINQLAQGVELWAVIKADAYGHGLLEVASEAEKAGALGFCVAYIDEAMALRTAGFEQPILVLGVVEPMDGVVLASQNNITLSASSLDWIKRAYQAVSEVNQTLKIHLGIDTGMGRIGLCTDSEMIDTKNFLDHQTTLLAEGIFTHFATADEIDETYFNYQQQNFEHALDIFGRDFRYIHTSNTATALWHGAWNSNLVRFGVGIYGMNPSGTVKALPYDLEPAMRVETEIIYIKRLAKGKSVSYGATYTAQEDEWIATLPLGYADGFLRRYTGFELLIDGHRCPIVGRVTMDQMMIRVPEKYPIGTKVTVIGKSGDEENTFSMAADHIGTINYELTTILGQRLERVYVD